MDIEALVGDLETIVIGAVAVTTRALTDAAPGVDLTFTQWRAMLVIGDGDKGTRIGTVASSVGVTLPATSRLLRRLERRGLVALATDDTDRRATLARLTARGRRVRRDILAYRRVALHEIALGVVASTDTPPSVPIAALADSLDRFAR